MTGSESGGRVFNSLAAGERDMQTAHSGCVKSAGVKWPAAGGLELVRRGGAVSLAEPRSRAFF